MPSSPELLPPHCTTWGTHTHTQEGVSGRLRGLTVQGRRELNTFAFIPLHPYSGEKKGLQLVLPATLVHLFSLYFVLTELLWRLWIQPS